MNPTGLFPVHYHSYSRGGDTIDMRNPYLVQRVLARNADAVAPFGGLIGYYKQKDQFNQVKLTGDESAALRKIIPMDYMGSAEYEFGAVFKALEAMATKASGLIETSFTIKGKPAKFCFVDSNVYNQQVNPREATVYALCIEAHAEPLEKYFTIMGADNHTLRHKEVPCIQAGLFGQVEHPEYSGRHRRNVNRIVERKPSYDHVTGWLELDMHWFASTDKTQLDYVKVMLGM